MNNGSMGMIEARDARDEGAKSAAPGAAPGPSAPAAASADPPADGPVDAPGSGPAPADQDSRESEGSWRERAADAERRMAALADRLASAERAADELRRTLEGAIRARRIDVELLRAGVRDLEAGRGLVEEDEPDVAEAVRRVVATRPGLFARRGALSARAPVAEEHGRPDRRRRQIADAARESGDRRLVLRYLRARRGLQG